MVGPILEQLPLELVETYWVPDGEFPDHEPNPLLPENREFIIAQGARDRRRPRHRLGRRRRPLLLHRRRRRVRPRRLPHRAAGRVACSRRSRAPTSSTTCAPRAPCRTRSTRLGGRALVNRVGHAFFKTRMRDEGGEFGGEVSGHYYFKAFYNADSGTIPALLILELLSKREHDAGRRCWRELRSKYFICGEINSTVADQQAKMDEIKARYADAEITELDGISIDYDGLALQRAPVEHRAAAAPEPREPGLPGGHGAPARRAARADPVVIHRLPIPTPFRVGRGQLLPDRGRPADAGRRRARTRARSLVALEDGLRELGRRVEDLERIVITHQHADHLGLVGIVADRSGAEVCALDVLAPVVEDFGAYAERNDELAQALMRRHGDRAGRGHRAGAVTRAYRGWGGSAPVTRRLRDGGELAFAGRTLRRSTTGPGHSPSDTIFFDAAAGELIAGDHLIKHISSNPLISRRSAGAPATRSAAARAADVHGVAARDARACRSRPCCPATATPFGDHARADRRALRHARAPRAQVRRADRRAAAHRARDRAGDLGQRRASRRRS